MKILLILLVLVSLSCQAYGRSPRRKSAFEDVDILSTNPLYKDLFRFGKEKFIQKVSQSHGLVFASDAWTYVNTVKSEASSGLRVEFGMVMQDVHGKLQNVRFEVLYQSWKNYMGFKSYKIGL